ncbi:MAG TPA: phosphatidate cytidylyltransferase [Vicinamibacterales bacterium]|nr:phosphatidate cytidylyltransferase [Vicinamibacterales bacterium]
MTRFLSGAVLIAVVGAAVLWAPSPVLLGLATVVVVLAVHEYVALAKAAGAPVPRGATVIAALAVSAVVALATSFVSLVIVAVVLAQAIRAIGSRQPLAGALPGVAASVFGPLYVGFPLGALVAVHAAAGPAAALMLIGIIAVSDTAQYYGGRLFGRRQLAPVISPKKTIEGAVTGVIVATIAFVALGQWLWPGARAPFLAFFGLVIAVLGIAGDLFESLLKRSVGVKDSSTLIPGHGGVLDRIDALLFAAPVYYAMLPYAVRTS